MKLTEDPLRDQTIQKTQMYAVRGAQRTCTITLSTVIIVDRAVAGGRGTQPRCELWAGAPREHGVQSAPCHWPVLSAASCSSSSGDDGCCRRSQPLPSRRGTASHSAAPLSFCADPSLHSFSTPTSAHAENHSFAATFPGTAGWTAHPRWLSARCAPAMPLHVPPSVAGRTKGTGTLHRWCTTSSPTGRSSAALR